jgi:hypothetical protein
MEKEIEVTKEFEYVYGNQHWFTYSAEQTGLRMVCLKNLDTGAIVATTTANPDKRTASVRAWASARQSRASGHPWEIMHEMGEKGIDSDQKLEEMFRNYGHASVGDLARITVDFSSIPMHLCFALFSLGSINSGQEKSTRYQPKFNKAQFHPLKNYLPAHVPEDDVSAL